MSDGTFGTTAELERARPRDRRGGREPSLRSARRTLLAQRQARLPLAAALLASLEARPPDARPRAAREADDHLALARAGAQCPRSRPRRAIPHAVRLLWEVCQIPDFRKVMSDTHARLLAQIYRHLAGPAARLPSDWVAEPGRPARPHRRRHRHADGAHRPYPHLDLHRASPAIGSPTAAHWQERARAIEDKLSDALHDRITQRFVDRRSAFLVRRLAAAEELLASVSRDGEVKVEGHYVGRLDGFRFVPDPDANRRRRRRPCSPPPTACCAARSRARARASPRARCRVRAGAGRRRRLARRRGRAAAAGRRARSTRASRRCPAISSRAICATWCASGSPASLAHGDRTRPRALFRARLAELAGAGARPRLPARRGARQPAGARSRRRSAPRSPRRPQGAGAARRAARHRDRLFRCRC